MYTLCTSNRTYRAIYNTNKESIIVQLHCQLLGRLILMKRGGVADEGFEGVTTKLAK